LLKDNKEVVLAGKTRAQVFIPLCGKAHELKWFADLGHRVVGVEFIEDCVREYFAEKDLKLEEATCPAIGCKILQTPDKRLRVFICSIYDFRRYSSVLKLLLAPGCSYGMWTISYDAPWYKLNPRSVTEEALLEHYGDVAKPVLVDSYIVEREDFINGSGPVTYSLWHMST
ncbi:hypothetical protein MTO96_041366, partial [Rhipicephalus appendiculatus]